MAKSVIVTADQSALLPKGTRVLGIVHTLNTSGTEGGFDFYDAATPTGTVVLRSRTGSIPVSAYFGSEGILFDTAVSIDKTGTGDSTLTIIYKSSPLKQ